ncbi:unnamed protein product [Discula destructiva]
MTDFLRCCFPSAQRVENDDKIKLVSAAALPGSMRARHNDKLKSSISHSLPQRPQPAILLAAAHPSNPYPYMRRRQSEDIQDRIEDQQLHQDGESTVAFSNRDRAHGHVLRDLHATLRHSKWAVSGSYAEALWGCSRSKRRDIVSIICQASSRATTKVWLTSQLLFTVSPADEDVLEYQGDTRGSAPISVRIRWVSDRELERLGSVEGTFKFREGHLQPVETITFVLLTLPALADNLALSWVKATDPRVRNDVATNLFAVLDRIVQLDFAVLGSGPLNAENNVHTMHKSFWLPFAAAHPEAPATFAKCGLPIPDSGRVITTQPPQQTMQMSPSSPLMPFERPDSFQKPRSVPAPPSAASREHGRSLTTPSSKPALSSKPPSSSRHRKSSSSSKTTRSSTTRSSSSSRSRSEVRVMNTDKIAASPRDQKYYRELKIPASPLLSPQRPVHPANILPPATEPRSRVSKLLGLKESAETVERRRREQLEQDREARRAADKFSAQVQRNRIRDREREWHTRKQAERMGSQEPRRKPGTSS